MQCVAGKRNIAFMFNPFRKKETEMKRWIKRTVFGLFGAGLVLGSLAACSHRHEGHGWTMSAEDQSKFKARMVDRVGGKLDLNDDQKKRLGTLADALQAQRLALAGKTTDPRAEMQALVSGPKFDVEKAQGLLNEKTSAVSLKSPEVIAALADFYDNLRPEQQAKVREFMQKRHGWGHRG
ncbi:MAG: hypothetical protein RLZZ401_454 [Pseudomonadota bacterium]|jgi:Spy/CpxP family protein refolding chaperone